MQLIRRTTLSSDPGMLPSPVGDGPAATVPQTERHTPSLPTRKLDLIGSHWVEIIRLHLIWIMLVQDPAPYLVPISFRGMIIIAAIRN
jgi:hypothetical protein